MRERLQKILSARGVASRRKGEALIQAGKVLINGIPAKLGDTADPDTDEITVEGQPLPGKTDYVYLMLNKPRGFVTTLSDEQGRKNAAQLVEDCGVRVYPVGRLDMDSQGLLLFTNDGELANHLMHPRGEVNKTYHVVCVDYEPGKEEALARPITLDGYTIKKPEIKLLKTAGTRAEFLVTIHEGRNRQVRRMCRAAGMQVRRLIRIAEGNLSLGELPTGKWRYLTAEEIQKLRGE